MLSILINTVITVLLLLLILLLLLSNIYMLFNMASKAWLAAQETVTELSNKSAQKLEKKSFNFLLKSMRLRLSSWSTSGRLFHARGHETANVRPEIVLVLVFGTTSLPLAAVAERRSIRPGITRIEHFSK